jgi:Glutathione S-transferase, N-terminal domain
MTTLYSMQRSGNCYKVRLALAQLNIPYRLVEIDILKGETRTPEFLSKNPNGHVPLLEVSPGCFLPESGAILWCSAFLAQPRQGRTGVASRCGRGLDGEWLSGLAGDGETSLDQQVNSLRRLLSCRLS